MHKPALSTVTGMCATATPTRFQSSHLPRPKFGAVEKKKKKAKWLPSPQLLCLSVLLDFYHNFILNKLVKALYMGFVNSATVAL